MKKLGLLIAIAGLSVNVAANEAASTLSHLTIAAAETGSTIGWTIEKAEASFDSRLEQAIEERAEALNEKINASLEKSLEEKFRSSLNFQ